MRQDRLRALTDLGARDHDAYASLASSFNPHDGFQKLFSGSRKSCSVHECRESDAFANGRMLLVLLGEPPPLRVVVRNFQDAAEQRRKVDILANHLAGGRRISAVEKIACSEFFGTEPHGRRNAIHVTFEREDGLRRAKSSKGTARRSVRRHRAASNADVGTRVWARGVNRSPRQNNRAERGIRAAIDREVDIHCE